MLRGKADLELSLVYLKVGLGAGESRNDSLKLCVFSLKQSYLCESTAHLYRTACSDKRRTAFSRCLEKNGILSFLRCEDHSARLSSARLGSAVGPGSIAKKMCFRIVLTFRWKWTTMPLHWELHLLRAWLFNPWGICTFVFERLCLHVLSQIEKILTSCFKESNPFESWSLLIAGLTEASNFHKVQSAKPWILNLVTRIYAYLWFVYEWHISSPSADQTAPCCPQTHPQKPSKYYCSCLKSTFQSFFGHLRVWKHQK